MNALDGRVHGCLDSSAFVKGYTDTISPMLRSQVEIGSYITHINDHFVVGNTFASVLQLLREEKRPLRIRFEQGRAVEDPYAYQGELPVTAVSEVSEVERLSESLYDEGIHYLPNNVMIDSNHHAMVVMRLLLTMRSVSTIDNVRFLLRRRSVVPVYVNGEWIVEKQPISAYPRQLLLELLVQTIPQVLQQNQLVDLFNVLNAVGETERKHRGDAVGVPGEGAARAAAAHDAVGLSLGGAELRAVAAAPQRSHLRRAVFSLYRQ